MMLLVVFSLLSVCTLSNAVATMKTVLIVVDFQKAYAKPATGPLDPQVNCYPTDGVTDEPTNPVVMGIQDALSNPPKPWDLVVFTTDYKNFDDTKGCFGTDKPASREIIQDLDAKYKGDKMYFRKETDDWLADESNSYKGSKPYDTDKKESARVPLAKQLEQRGFTEENTILHVTGIVTNRCVMKGEIHARYLGFQTILHKNGVWPMACDRWFFSKTESDCKGETYKKEKPYDFAPRLADINKGCPNGMKGCDVLKEIFFGWRGGPAPDLALAYMQAVGVQMEGSIIPGSYQSDPRYQSQLLAHGGGGESAEETVGFEENYKLTYFMLDNPMMSFFAIIGAFSLVSYVMNIVHQKYSSQYIQFGDKEIEEC